ncbi:hypothetical protein FHX74_001329 [Friedmanniella endophytica]|uniref:Glucoamylase (Glucan-1,4-alpha-glucosidase), GH15 family n=1 Tax=Microlunatus kandeliicorticis TaxID=1759536 RepID=A0A7W3P593_9ACTN|nr:glycoside hydrolase family 15 [Microlunatus kandeliicorticis]MBA8793724.1 hypothetical protein [Microlunatus kandeliicorticis]
MTVLAPAIPVADAPPAALGGAVAVLPGHGRRHAVACEARLLAVIGLVLLVLVGVAARPGAGRAVVPLLQQGIAVGAGGRVQPVSENDRLVPGTRVLADAPDAPALVAAQRAWLATGTVPRVPELGASTMISDALLDLDLLSAGHRAATAGWDGPWAYVWPRDSAFVAVALARTGHPAEALSTLAYLEHVQGSDGSFQARYLPDRSTTPDARRAQLDGTGWAAWALDQTATTLPGPAARALLDQRRALLTRSTSLLLARTAGPGFPVSSDYWEVDEHRPTLATSAVLLAGLTSAAACWNRLGDHATAARLTARAVAFRARLVGTATPGFGRHLGDPAGTADLGLAFLLPPFAPATAGPGPVLPAWRTSLATMARPSGGLAPGGGWKSDGISWTPTTATEAMTAAALGDRAEAVRLLRWIDAHRTAQGAIPEKVLWNGQPASVAPLGWSAAAVVITATELAGTAS